MTTGRKIPGKEVIQSILDVYQRGQSVEALRRAESFAPLQDWTGVEECVIASRIAANTGAPRLASRLSIRAWRLDKNHPSAQVQFGFELSEKRGPLAVWLTVREWPLSPNAPLLQQAELLALQADAASSLRDFEAAESLLNRAEALGTRDAWVHLQRAHLLEHQDRVEEALEVATAASALHPNPFFRPGVQVRSHLLQLLDRDDDAIQLLIEAGKVLQSAPVAGQLFGLLSENGRWSEAEAALDRYVELSPLLEPLLQKWVTTQRARVAYHSGKRAEAAAFAAGLDDDFHRGFAKRLAEAPPPRERIHLDVSFVRQHFKTCAPATLAALGRFWQMPGEHLKLAEAMCYDGTPHWQQRRWAENNGWHVREFRLTHESAMALIELGIPFALSVVEATSAHMMAVVGFDRARQTILLRDPGQPYVIEASAEELLKRYQAFGPHAMVYLPRAESSRLEGVLLPEAEAYDHYYRFRLALAEHNRPTAAEVLASLEQLNAELPLTWEARLDLAFYDANKSEQARCLDRLLEFFPNHPTRLLQRLTCLQSASRDERIRFLEQACGNKDADPALFVELARALQGDARCLPEARRWLKRATRFRPLDSNVISARGDLCWEEGKFERATELYRCAANLESFREGLYQAWFLACRQTRRTHEAMAHLEARFARFGSRSEQPALTLAWALREMEQPGQAREVLKEAARLRPDDGQLLLRSATLVASLGEITDAKCLLEVARSRVRENDWLRAAAEIAENQFDWTSALKWARQLLEREPLALDAHSGVARSLSRLEGPAAALAHLKDACAQFPHHCGLLRMVVDWSREAGAPAVEAAARDLLAVEPADAWARRELAAALSQLNRDEEALQEARESARIEPRNSFSFSILGHIHRRCQRITEAQEQFRRAVELSVDNSDAIHALLDLARTDTQRKAELAFIERELVQQVVEGDGLLAFLELARPVVEPDKLLASLRQAHQERPDLWHARAALVSQLAHVGQLGAARDAALQATRDFPHLPRAWLDLALVHQWRQEPQEEIAAAQRAFEFNPAWQRATFALASAHERRGELVEAQRVYERALQHSAQDSQLHAWYAHLLWRQRKQEPAFFSIERALRLSPGHEWAWELLHEWASESGQVQRTVNFARALTQERPGDLRLWLMFTRVLADEPGALAERLAALDKALALDGYSTDAWDLKVETLANAELFEKAIQVCDEGIAVCTSDVFVLRGRRAWIEARRRRYPEAVKLMRAVLADNASFAWGWNQLAHWLGEQGEFSEAASALEQLARLRPHDAWVSRQLGFLRLKQKDYAGAKSAFTKALHLAPTDSYAARNSFDLQLQIGDLDGAAATLRLMELHQPGARTLASEIFLSLRGRDKSAPVKGFQKLCALPDPDPWPVEAATDAFLQAGRGTRALKVLKRALKSNSCNPQVGAAAVRLYTAQRRDLAALWFFCRLKPGEVQRRAAAPMVQGLAELKSRFLLRVLLWLRRDVLRKDDAAWGQVGFALSTFRRMKAVALWLADWRERPNVQPWMLFNLCLGLRHLGQWDEANAVARHVLDTWGHREGSADMHLFLAVEEALSGSLPAAREHLNHARVRENVIYDLELVAIAKALIEFRKAPASGRVDQFKVARAQLGQSFSGWRLLRVTRDVRRTFKRAGKAFVNEGGGWRARLWFGWKLNWQWLLLPLTPLFLALLVQPPVLVGSLIWLWARRREN
ncbi:MAG TPA: tetratricopeptide repeat protein [Verrucomicrobiae bacterium]|nr:tetratricopeptide repeat protein [Verrucomicrobiae bacterium]